MVVYTPHNIHITKQNVVHLMHGRAITLRHSHLTGEHPVFLNKSQCDDLERARGDKKGVLRLKFSKDAMKHHYQHGGGFWDTIKKGAEKLLKHIPVKELAVKGFDKLIEAAKPHIHGAIGKAAGHAGKYIGHETAAHYAKKAAELLERGHQHGKQAVHDYATKKGYGLNNPGMHGRGVAPKRRRQSKAKPTIVAGRPWPVRQGAS
jgi:hypothetical protein